ncbi:MAG: hypothetical protein GY778_29545 [bacterium]|nr:hypothetical protein [bacterium]
MRSLHARTAWGWCWFWGLPALLCWAVTALPASAQTADEPDPVDADTDGAEPQEDVAVDTEADDRTDADAPKTPGAPASPRSDQPERRDELSRAKQLLKLVRAELDLRDEQAVRVNDLFEEHFEALAELIKNRERHRRENAARMEELREELTRAQREGDREAIQEIRGELRELMGANSATRELHREFNAAVLEELDEEQAEKYRELVQRVMSTSSIGMNKLREIQVMNRALRELDLPPQQRRAAMKHLRGLRDILAGAREAGDDAVTQAVDELREAILGELDEEQIAQFEEAEERVRSSLQHQRRPGAGRAGRTYDRDKAKEDGAAVDEESGAEQEAEQDEPHDPDGN